MKKTSLRFRLYRMLMGLLLLFVVSIGTIVCSISYRTVMELSVETCNQLVEKTASELDVLLDGMSSIPVVIGRDSRIQQSIREGDQGDSLRSRWEYEINMFLSEMNQYDSNISAIYFFAENGVFAQSKFYRARVTDLAADPLYQEACRQGKTIWRQPQNGSSVAVTTSSERVIATATPVQDIRTGEYAGMVVIEMEEKRLAAYLETGIGKGGFLYVCDENGTPIVCPPDLGLEGVEERLRQNEASPLFGSGGLTIRQELQACNWSVIGVIPRADLMDNVSSIIRMTILICAILLVIAGFATVRTTGAILQRIDLLNQKMGQVAEGDLTVRVEITRCDEIGTLMERFNQMVQRIDMLVRREAENQKQLRLTEFKALQAQIRPHFLYNTLDSIVWMARANDQAGVVNTVLALTDFLKIGLSKGDEIITLEEEIRHTSSYLRIQGVRYKGQFVHEIILEDAVKAFQVPKLIVQPLVENAIYHGIKLKRELCHLKIWAREEGDRVVIDVMDDGVGMKPAVEARLKSVLRNHETGSSGYGIANVNERIQIMYGEEFGVTFETEYGEGSVFRITLPKHEGGGL